MSDCPAHPYRKCACGPLLGFKPPQPNPRCVHCHVEMGMYCRNHVWYCTECWKAVE